jgi:hypothetical protein
MLYGSVVSIGTCVQARGNSWGQLIFEDLIKFD